MSNELKIIRYDEIEKDFQITRNQVENLKKILKNFIFEQQLHYEHNYEQITWEQFINVFKTYINIDIDLNKIVNILFKTQTNKQEKNSPYAWCFNINSEFIIL
jgi:hypothetical protein